MLSPSDDEALDVHVGGRHVGTLASSDVEEDTFLFTYAQKARPADAVSLTMPVIRDAYDSMTTVHPIFEMNLPEGALREKLRVLFAKVVPRFDDLALLSIVGQSQIGRLRYARHGHALTEVPAEDLERLLTHDGAHDLYDDLVATYARHSGISGMQPKILLRSHAIPERMTRRGATHIVKSFDAHEYPELAANEFFCLEAARRAGLPVARAKLSKNRRLLVVERFDLRPDGAYLGLEDFCVLSALRAHGRYEGSYELVAKRVRQFVSPARQREALEQLFSMVALSCAVENGDAHLKNFAVIYEDPTSEVGLAPAYDIVSTTPYRANDVLALTLGGAKELPDRKRLLAFGKTACGLGPRICSALLERVERGVADVIPEIRAFSRKAAGFASFGKVLVAAFERGLRRLEGR